MKYLSLLILFAAMTLTGQTQKMEPLVSVSGEGKVKVVPDGVDIRVRVETQGKEAQSIKLENDQIIDRVLKFLRAQDIADENIQTEYINLNKNYDYNAKVYNYTANQTLSITLKDLSKYEVVMSGLLNSGINRIDNVQFTSSQMESLRAQARVKAIINAKLKAEAYAKALDQSIGKAVQISEQGSSAPQPPMYKSRMMAMESDSSGSETIAPGEISISSQVFVSFELN